MISDLARQNAIPLELKKDGLSQRQSGDWMLRFVVQGCDMDERLMKAAMGTRFQAALVEIGDDELPKEVMPHTQQPSKSTDARPQKEPQPSGAKHSWRDLQPAAQAGIRCDDPIFRSFLTESHGFGASTPEIAAIAVRDICDVKSRSELSSNHKARVLWHQLDEQFQAWKTLEQT